MTRRPSHSPLGLLQLCLAFAIAPATLTLAATARPGGSVDSGPTAGTGAAAQPATATVSAAVLHDVSAPLTLLPPAYRAARIDREPLLFRNWRTRTAPPGREDAARQLAAPTPMVATPPTVFDGVGDGFRNFDGTTFSISSHPPDTDGDVGPNHYVQIVNTGFAIFDKTGKVLFGSVDTNTIWTGFDADCATHNDGDGVVLYDAAADRWFLSQFAVTDTGPWFQCVAISKSGDPTGQYYRYKFPYDGFNDYGKFGVWPDAYYATFNSFSSGANGNFQGAVACAYDRASMLQGSSANQQCIKLFQTDGASPPNALYGGVLPTDLDGPASAAPPAGAPNYLMSFDGTTNLQMWKFHVDWATPAKTALTGSGVCTAVTCPPILIPVTAYVPLCFDNPQATGTCIPQESSTGQLDSLADRPMFRIAYRNFGDHESLLMNHSVAVSGAGGVRWYELRDLGLATPTVHQQGTFAPDANFRWMGSLAMDGSGGIALGYSLSGTSVFPSIDYTSRGPNDPPGIMTAAEIQIAAGLGPQGGATPPANQGLSRWGDYSNMAIDPVDDCTFWYTTEYVGPGPDGNWKTAIASFQLPSCASFTVAAPATGSMKRGGSAQFAITTSTTAALKDTLDLSVSGLPGGVSGAFNPGSIPIGQGSQLTLTADTSTTHSLHAVSVLVTATLRSTGQSRSALVLLDVVGNEFSLTPSPAEVVLLSAGSTRTVTLKTQAVNGTPEMITLSFDALSGGVGGTVSPQSLLAGASATLTLNAAATAGDHSQPLTIHAVASSSSHDASLMVRTLTLPTPSVLLPIVGTQLIGPVDFSLITGISPFSTLARLELLVDGNPVGTPLITSPGSIHVDTKQLSNGTRQFTARATDASGGTALSAPVALTVNNPTGCGCGSGPGSAIDGAALLGLLALLRLVQRRKLDRAG